MAEQTNVPDDATCLGCGYRLVNLPARTCPECGRWFDPQDSTTYQIGPKTPRWRRFARPPNIAECLLISALTVYGLIKASGPARWETGQVPCLAMLIGVPVWLGIAALVVVRLVASWRDKERATQDQSRLPHRRRWRWSVAPICAVLVLSSFVYPWQLMVRFRLSQPAFAAALKEFHAGNFTAGQWVGLYHIRSVSTSRYVESANRPDAVCFETGYSFIDPVGFEYDPHPGHMVWDLSVEVAPLWYTYED